MRLHSIREVLFHTVGITLDLNEQETKSNKLLRPKNLLQQIIIRKKKTRKHITDIEMFLPLATFRLR